MRIVISQSFHTLAAVKHAEHKCVVRMFAPEIPDVQFEGIVLKAFIGALREKYPVCTLVRRSVARVVYHAEVLPP